MTTIIDNDNVNTETQSSTAINSRPKDHPDSFQNSQATEYDQFWSRFNPFVVLYKTDIVRSSLIATGFLIYFAIRVQQIITKVGPSKGILIHGDSWLFPYEDKSDPQWNSFLRGLPSIIVLMSAHLLLTNIVDRVSNHNKVCRFYFQAIFGIIALKVTHGWKGALLVLFFTAMYYAMSLLAPHSSSWTRRLSWTLTLALCLGNFKQFRNSEWFSRTFGILIPSNPLVAMPIAYRFLCLRGQSFIEDKVRALYNETESIDQNNSNSERANDENVANDKAKTINNGEDSVKKEKQPRYFENVLNTNRSISDYSLIGFLAYVAYLPIYSAGPISTYNAFAHYASVKTKANRKWIIERALSIVFMMVCTHVINRVYLPFSLSRNFQYWEHMSLLDLHLLVAVTLLYIWLKLKTLWDLFRLWSVLAGFYVTDNMAEFLFNANSQRGFWKFWHHSYHVYLRRYIYLPLGGKRYQFWANVGVFGFVALWHVLDADSIAWFVLTAAGLGVEALLSQSFGVNLASYPPKVWGHPHISVVAIAAFTLSVCWTQYIAHGCFVEGIPVLVSHVIRRPYEIIGVLILLYILVVPWRAAQFVTKHRVHSEGKPEFVFDFTSSGEPVVEELSEEKITKKST